MIPGRPLGLNKTPGNRRARERAKSLKTHLNREPLPPKLKIGHARGKFDAGPTDLKFWVVFQANR